MEQSIFQVIVGNIGTVYEGNQLKQALIDYKEYIEQSKNNYGRVSQESVAIFKNGEPWKEYSPV